MSGYTQVSFENKSAHEEIVDCYVFHVLRQHLGIGDHLLLSSLCLHDPQVELEQLIGDGEVTDPGALIGGFG